MEREIVLVMDYRYDEGARPRKDKIIPCLTTKIGRGGLHIPSNEPLILERWTQSESNKQQNKDISK